jgi:hypothetical protein
MEWSAPDINLVSVGGGVEFGTQATDVQRIGSSDPESGTWEL